MTDNSDRKCIIHFLLNSEFHLVSLFLKVVNDKFKM